MASRTLVRCVKYTLHQIGREQKMVLTLIYTFLRDYRTEAGLYLQIWGVSLILHMMRYHHTFTLMAKRFILAQRVIIQWADMISL